MGRFGGHVVGTRVLDEETLVDESTDPTGEQTVMRRRGEGKQFLVCARARIEAAVPQDACHRVERSPAAEGSDLGEFGVVDVVQERAVSEPCRDRHVGGGGWRDEGRETLRVPAAIDERHGRRHRRV